MSDYIEREAAVEKFKSIKDQTHSIHGRAYVDGIISMLQEVPAADVRPVVRGRWKYFHKQNKAVCTVCSFERDLDQNFGVAIACPNCGADMREETNCE